MNQMTANNIFNGIPIILNEHLTNAIVKRKIWKRNGFGREPKIRVRSRTVSSSTVFKMGDTFAMHPALFEQFKKDINGV